MAYVVIAGWTVAPEDREAVLAAMLVAQEATRSEDPACSAYQVLVNAADAHRLGVFESYTDEAAFDAHLAGPIVAALSQTLRGRIKDPLRTAYLTP